MPQPVRFRSKLEVTDSEPPWHIVRVSKSRVADFGFKGNLRRVICTLNDTETFNCSLFPSKGDYFITINKGLRSRLGLAIGDNVWVQLTKDESRFGMPMPDEFAEVLRQDEEGAQLFEALSPGNQRLMLKLIVFVKNVDKRILRSLVGIELLKKQGGHFDYSLHHDAMRAACLLGEARLIDTNESVRFRAVLTKAPAESGWHFIPVDAKIGKQFEKQYSSRRVVCTINGSETFQCALIPWGDTYTIIVNKTKRERLKIIAGDRINVLLEHDDSKYGLPMPEELEEVLNQDPDGDRLFHGLTAGKQRSILYFLGNIKGIDRRIHNALIFIEHLKKNDGKIDSPALQQELKRPML